MSTNPGEVQIEQGERRAYPRPAQWYTPAMNETPNDITRLLRQAQSSGLNPRPFPEGYRIAGRAFAEEGLETDAIRQDTDERIERAEDKTKSQGDTRI